jgi:hypothetical protein
MVNTYRSEKCTMERNKSSQEELIVKKKKEALKLSQNSCLAALSVFTTWYPCFSLVLALIQQ